MQGASDDSENRVSGAFLRSVSQSTFRRAQIGAESSRGAWLQQKNRLVCNAAVRGTAGETYRKGGDAEKTEAVNCRLCVGELDMNLEGSLGKGAPLFYFLTGCCN